MSSPRLFALVSTMACSSLALGSHGLTVEDYVARVLAESTDAQLLEVDLHRAEGERRGAGVWPNPSLQWQREAGLEVGDAQQDIFSLNLPLVLSGRLGLEEDAADLGIDAARRHRARGRAELRAHATRVYFAAVAAAERAAVLTRSLSALAELAGAMRARERAGEAAGYEHLRIELANAEVSDELRAAGVQQRLATADLLLLLGAPSAATPPILASALSPAHTPEPTPLEQAVARRADLQALDDEAHAAVTRGRAAERSWIPDPVLSGGAQRFGEPDALKRGYVVGVALPLPIFDRRQGDAARARAEAQRLELLRARKVRELELGLQRIDDAAAQAVERWTRHREDVLARARELQTIARKAYAAGAIELLVLVDAEDTARSAELASIDLAVAAIDAQLTRDLLVGRYDAEKE